MSMQSTYRELTINELSLMFAKRQIHLDPGFQRRSVWTISDRRHLIQSIVAGYPVPSIFLYRRNHHGSLIYDVIDGKQRLETIFMFTGLGRFKRERFDVRLKLGDREAWYDWPTLRRQSIETRTAFDSYKIQTVEVSGDLREIVHLFVRINSTGKRLTSAEKRNADFYESPFLKEADRLVRKFHNYLLKQHILSKAQIDRMRGTELFAELLMSVYKGGPINKKVALDRAIGNETINGNTLGRLSRECVSAMNVLRRMIPDLRPTRFHNSTEFYTLFLLIWELQKEGFVLTEKRRNRVAFELLRKFSTGVDDLREKLKNAIPARSAHRLYADYLLTVRADTDSTATRERRAGILRNLLFSLFNRKDKKRLFTSEQRRIIWNGDDPRCAKCGRPVTWDNYSVDHMKPHVKGGRTTLKNAQPMHRNCNSAKGAR